MANIKGDHSDIENYSFGALLGQGAYATVHSVTYIPTGQQYAIKTYEKDTLLDPRRKKAVHREVRIL